MSYFDTRAARIFVPVALAMVVVVTSCVDGPAAPDEVANPTFGPTLAFVPMFSLVGPGGEPRAASRLGGGIRPGEPLPVRGATCVDERDRDRQDRGPSESLPALNRTRPIGFGRPALSLPQKSSLSATNIV